MEVRDGDSKAKVAGQLCGHVNPPTFTSRTNKVHVSFTTDSKNDWGRFNFTWTFVRKGNCLILILVESLGMWNSSSNAKVVVLGIFS